MTTPTPPPPPSQPDGYGAMPPAPDLQPSPEPGRGPDDDPSGAGGASSHNPWPIVIGLGAIAAVLIIGVIVTSAIVILRGAEDPTAKPGPVPVTPATSSSASPDPSASAPAGDSLAADLFGGDWDFKLGGVSMSATYVASQDYPECGPIGSAALEKKGCDYAAMGIHDAEDGKLRMLRVIYVFGSDAEATAAAASVEETDFDLPTGSLVPDDVIGKWVAKESSKAVVVGFVTAQKGVSEERVDDFLHYGTADIAGALMFMDL